jgi:hypothetical protein
MTDTTIGSPAGEHSKQSFAHALLLRQSTRTPASNVERKSTSTRADRL